MKILVIDDEKPTLSMFKLFLAAYGYEVHTAESGEQGLALFQDLAPDIVFTDIRMPGIDGLEVLRSIRQAAPGCQVIIITGHGDMEMALEALDLAASDFINKPVEREALNAALIKAENRVRKPEPSPFSLDLARKGEALWVTVRGRLTRSAGPTLDRVKESLARGEQVRFELDPDFSIDRQGISLLIRNLQAMTEKGIEIRISGLSYNYLKFFEMAGIHKLAALEAAPSEEPGL